jgi:hypothetical protein
MDWEITRYYNINRRMERGREGWIMGQITGHCNRSIRMERGR